MAARDLTKLTSQELGAEITVVSDSLSKLNKRENDIKTSDDPNSNEATTVLRTLRSQRRELDRQLKELSALKVYADKNITKIVDVPSTPKSNNTTGGKKTRAAKEKKMTD